MNSVRDSLLGMAVTARRLSHLMLESPGQDKYIRDAIRQLRQRLFVAGSPAWTEEQLRVGALAGEDLWQAMILFNRMQGQPFPESERLGAGARSCLDAAAAKVEWIETDDSSR